MKKLNEVEIQSIQGGCDCFTNWAKGQINEKFPGLKDTGLGFLMGL